MTVGVVKSVHLARLRLNTEIANTAAAVKKYPMVEIIRYGVGIVTHSCRASAGTEIAGDVKPLRGRAGGVRLFLRIQLHVPARRYLHFISFPIHIDRHSEAFRLRKGGVCAEGQRHISRSDIFHRVFRAQSFPAQRIGDGHFKRERVAFALAVGKSYGNRAVADGDRLKLLIQNKSVKMTVKARLVQRKAIFLAFKHKFCFLGAIGGHKNRRAPKIRIDLKLSLVLKRAEYVFAPVGQPDNISAKTGTDISRPISRFYSNYIFYHCYDRSFPFDN